MWGYQDACTNVFLFQVLGFEFTTKSDPFAVQNIWMGVSDFVFNLIQGRLDTKNKQELMIYTASIGVLGLICNATTYLFKFKTKPSKESQLQSK